MSKRRNKSDTLKTQSERVLGAGAFPSTSRYLTVQEVMAQLGISDETIYRYIKSGKLKAVRVGGLWRVPPNSLIEFLNARQPVAQPIAQENNKE